MLKTFALPLLLLASACACADEADFLKPQDPQAFDVYMKQAARYEAALFTHDKPSMLDSFLLGPTTPDEIRAEYERNELAAKKKYSNHSIRIKGKIDSINEDAFGRGYVVAVDNTSDMGMGILNGIRLEIDKNEPVWLELSKGDDIDAICQVGTYVLGTPTMSKCFLTSRIRGREFFENMAGNLTGRVLLRAKDISVENIAKIRGGKQIRGFIIYASFYKGNEQRNAAACRQDGETCTLAFLDDMKMKKNGFIDAHNQDYLTLKTRVEALQKLQQQH